MPGYPTCHLCPFRDSDLVCWAIQSGHRPFCDPSRPDLKEGVRRITLELAGLWVEPTPEPPAPAGPDPWVGSSVPPTARAVTLPRCLDRGPRVDAVSGCKCSTWLCRKHARVVDTGECVRCAAAGYVYAG